ncbi:MAG: prepilin-type N-terminal cleavage/methylation domain-containing protein [Acidobacteriota bacterium]
MQDQPGCRQVQVRNQVMINQATTTQISQSKGQQGYSLVELLIALAIILILAALAVPNYMAAKARANEAAAASSVRAIISAQNLYRNTFGNFGTLSSLGGEYLTDNVLASGYKSGYYFDSTPGASADLQFSVEATPQLSIGPSATGQRHYYGDESAVIRFSLTGSATSSSPVID